MVTASLAAPMLVTQWGMISHPRVAPLRLPGPVRRPPKSVIDAGDGAWATGFVCVAGSGVAGIWCRWIWARRSRRDVDGRLLCGNGADNWCLRRLWYHGRLAWHSIRLLWDLTRVGLLRGNLHIFRQVLSLGDVVHRAHTVWNTFSHIEMFRQKPLFSSNRGDNRDNRRNSLSLGGAVVGIKTEVPHLGVDNPYCPFRCRQLTDRSNPQRRILSGRDPADRIAATQVEFVS